nr:MAG: RNA-dependent RNA polymerase [Wufeng shrew picorna-like virus 27]
MGANQSTGQCTGEGTVPVDPFEELLKHLQTSTSGSSVQGMAVKSKGDQSEITFSKALDSISSTFNVLKPVNGSLLLCELIYCKGWKDATTVVIRLLELYGLLWLTPALGVERMEVLIALLGDVAPLAKSDIDSQKTPPEGAVVEKFENQAFFVTDAVKYQKFVKFFESIGLKDAAKILPTLSSVAAFVCTAGVLVLATIFGTDCLLARQESLVKTINQLGMLCRSGNFIDIGWNKLSSFVSNFFCSAFGCAVEPIADPAVRDIVQKALELETRIREFELQMVVDPAELLLDQQGLNKIRIDAAALRDLITRFALAKTNLGNAKLVFNRIENRLTELWKLEREVISSYVSKMEPVTIYLYGDFGVGKSRLVGYIIEQLGEMMGLDLTAYYRNATEEYWSGYVGQHVCVYDDFGNVSEDRDLFELINIYTNATYQLPMADLTEKGRVFSSQILIMCSNQLDIEKSSQLKSIQALQRRRDFLYHVTNPGVTKFREVHGKLPPEDDKKVWKSDYSHLELEPLCPLSEFRKQTQPIQKPIQAIRNAFELWTKRRTLFREHVARVRARVQLPVNQAVQKTPITWIEGPSGIGKTTLLKKVQAELALKDVSHVFVSGVQFIETENYVEKFRDKVILVDDVTVSADIFEKFRQRIVRIYDDPGPIRSVIFTMNSSLRTMFSNLQQKDEFTRRCTFRWKFRFKRKNFAFCYDRESLAKDFQNYDQFVSCEYSHAVDHPDTGVYYTFAEALTRVSEGTVLLNFDELEVGKMLTIGTIVPDYTISMRAPFEEVIAGLEGLSLTNFMTQYRAVRSLMEIPAGVLMRHQRSMTELITVLLEYRDRKFRSWYELFSFLASRKPRSSLDGIIRVCTGDGDFILGTDGEHLVVFLVDHKVVVPLEGVECEKLRAIYLRQAELKTSKDLTDDVKATVSLCQQWNVIPEVVKSIITLSVCSANLLAGGFAVYQGTKKLALSSMSIDYLKAACKQGVLIETDIFESDLVTALENDDIARITRAPNVAPRAAGRVVRPENDYPSVLTRPLNRAPRQMMRENADPNAVIQKKVNKAPKPRSNLIHKFETSKFDLRSVFRPRQVLDNSLARLPESVAGSQDLDPNVEFQDQQSLDQNAVELSRLVGKNLVKVSTNDDRHVCWGLMVDGRIGVTVFHAFAPGYLDAKHFCSFDLKGRKHSGVVVGIDKTRDLAIFELDAQTNMFPSLLRHIPLSSNAKPIENCGAIMLIADRNINTDVNMIHVKHLTLQTIRMQEGPDNGIVFAGATEVMRTLHPVGTVSGDCGSPLIVTNNDHMYKLIGIHKRASISSGFAADLYQEDFSDFVYKNQSIPKPIFLPFEHVTIFDDPVLLQNVVHVGTATPANFQTVKTSYWMSPLSPPFLPICHEPTILSPRDSRLPEGYDGDVRYDSFMKWDIAPPQNFDQELAVEAMEEIVEFFVGLVLKTGKKVKKITKTEAINRCSDYDVSNPINRSSSAGFPWKYMVKKSGKHEFFVFDEDQRIHRIAMDRELGRALNCAVDHTIDVCRRGESLGVVFQTALKDEVRPIERVRVNVKTRGFTPAPLHFVIAHRMYFHSAVALLREVRHSSPLKVGIDPMSPEWDSMVRDLLAKNIFGFDGDYEDFDARHPLWLVLFPSAVYRAIYFACDPNCNAVDDKIRSGLAKADAQPHVQFGTELVQFMMGIVSGKPTTTDDNGIINFFYLFYAWKVLCVKAQKPTWRGLDKYLQKVALAIFGDDNEVHPAPDVIEMYNLSTVSQVLRNDLNVVLKGSDKSDTMKPYQHFLEMEFLKRKHRLIGDRFVGVYGYKTFAKALHWMNTGPRHYYDRDEGLIYFKADSVVNTAYWALREAVLVGGEFFQMLYSHFCDVFSKFQLTNSLPTMTTLCIELGLSANIVRGMKHPNLDYIFEPELEFEEIVHVVRVDRGEFYHYGVQLGLNVYHMNSDIDDIFDPVFDGTVQMHCDSPEDFADGGEIEICTLMRKYLTPLPAHSVQSSIALYQDIDMHFDLIQFNCEHFAHLLVYGVSYSFQISELYKPLVRSSIL